MSSRNFCAAVVLSLAAPVAALAAPVNDLGTYELSNISFESLADRGVWTSGSGLVSGNNASHLWDVEEGGGTFTINGDDTARLTGVATNISQDGTLNTALQYTYDLQFSFVSDLIANPQAGYCQFGGPKIDCASPQTPMNVDVSVWDFFELTSGTFDFVGAYGSVSYDITDRSGGTHKGQAGTNANALIADDQNGFSMWFDAEQKAGSMIDANSGYLFASAKNGDFNVNMGLGTRTGGGPPITPMPLPASGLLLFVGLGGLAAFKRRKKA